MEELILSYGMNLIYATIILVAGWAAALWTRRLVRKALQRADRVDPTLIPIITDSVYYTILVIVLVAVLARFGVQTTSILAILGAAGLAIGLALQGALSMDIPRHP